MALVTVKIPKKCQWVPGCQNPSWFVAVKTGTPYCVHCVGEPLLGGVEVGVIQDADYASVATVEVANFDRVFPRSFSYCETDTERRVTRHVNLKVAVEDALHEQHFDEWAGYDLPPTARLYGADGSAL